MKIKNIRDYAGEQEVLNKKYVPRVLEWLHFFQIETKNAVIHIIEGPPESTLTWRKGKLSTRSRLLGINAKIRFSLGGILGECPSFRLNSLKARKNIVIDIPSPSARKQILIRKQKSDY